MTTRSIRAVATIAILVVLLPTGLMAQVQRNVVPLTSWPAPLYFQPTRAESQGRAKLEKPDALDAVSNEVTTLAATPVGSLVFVAMTPCRIADTRDGTYPAGFGPPTLTGGTSRTFAIQSPSSRCPVPSIAQAYSFNITVVPPGATFPGNINPTGALGYLTIWPTGVAQPFVSTLNSYLGSVAANAAIVPAGTNGSVDVFVYNTTDVIIDINGYYAPQSGITLAQGTAAAPSLSFAGDPGTGIFSSGASTLDVATGGTSRLRVLSNGNIGIGSTTATSKLEIAAQDGLAITGNQPFLTLRDTNANNARSIIQGANGNLQFFPDSSIGGDAAMVIQSGTGNVGIGTNSNNPPTAKLVVQANGDAVQGNGGTGIGVSGGSVSSVGVFGVSTNAYGVEGFSTNNYGVYGLGKTAGVAGASTNAYGVYGSSTNHYGVFGSSDNLSGVGGVSFSSTNPGVYGYNATVVGVEGGSSSGTGVHGSSSSGNGVLGESNNSVGVYGSSSNGYGVYGSSGNGTGVYGESSGPTNPGVLGSGNNAPGVWGDSFGSVGVFARSQNGPGIIARSVNNNLVEGYPSFSGSVRTFHIMLNGTYVAGSDFAEALPAQGDKADYEPGDVLVLSTKTHSTVEKNSQPYDERVAGVYSTRPGMLGADKAGATRVDPDDLPVAIMGVVPTKVSAENGPIEVGDVLTTSTTLGHAMRCDDRLKCFGAILGKAMEPLAGGTGVIKVLVTLR